MPGKRFLAVLVVSLLASVAAPLGAAAAQAVPPKPLAAPAGCGAPCPESSTSPMTLPTEGPESAAAAPAGFVACPIRAGCRAPEAPAPTIAVQYVEPPPEEPAPAAPSGPSAAGGGRMILGVPLYRQIWNLDCETAALQMGLAYLGSYYDQPSLFALQNNDTRPPVLDGAGNIVQWGNPYIGFVGNVHGSEQAKTGYGVYWPVILSIAHSHGAPGSYGGEGLSAETVYAALAARHPVEIWINYGFTTYAASTWTSWDGKAIRYTLHEHAVTLTGVSAGAVLVNDPWPGSQYWVSKSAFEASWAVFNNMAVVFR